MSPEQARGVRADHRADLFSLGVVCYEMVTGVAPFRRDTAAETMTAILREPAPDLAEAIACPTALQRILQHCLEKDPNERFQSARDLVFSLEAAVDGKPPPPRSGRPFENRTVLAALAATAVVSSVIAALRDRAADGRPLRATRGQRDLPIHRFQRAGGVSGDLAGSEIGRVHCARRRVPADLRPTDGGRPAAADHQGCRRPPAAALVARRERDHLLFARRLPGKRKARSGRSPRSGARRDA